MLAMFHSSAFELNISIVQQDDEGGHIEDDKLLLKLGELEEHLSNLQIFLAMRNGENSPTLKALDLSSMQEKQLAGKLVANSDIRSLMELLNETEEESRTPLKLDQFKERAKSRLSSRSIFKSHKSIRSSRSFTPRPPSKGSLGFNDISVIH